MKLLLLAVLLVAVNALVPLETHREVVRGSYIVTLKPSVNSQSRKMLTRLILDKDPVNEITHEWTIINGFAARMSHETVRELRKMDDTIEAIEEDGVAHAFVNCQSGGTTRSGAWGVRRSTTGGCGTSWTFNEPSTQGAGTRNYILDTGVRCTHTEFSGGRAVAGASFINGENPCQDGNGHGTHVAGTVAGTTVGMARQGQIVDVKVLSAGGSGSFAGVISGVDWAAADATSTGKSCSSGRCMSTANMSLGGGASSAVDTAINNANSGGLLVVVAAGNNNGNSCSYSPARAPGAYTVGSTTSTNARSSFSNYGSCTNIFGPGSSIESSYNSNDNSYSSLSGTSMASPHIAGVAAQMMGAASYSSTTAAKNAITGDGINDCVTGIPSGHGGTPNVLGFSCA